MICVFYYMTGTPEGSPKVVYGEDWNRTCDPWFSKILNLRNSNLKTGNMPISH